MTEAEFDDMLRGLDLSVRSYNVLRRSWDAGGKEDYLHYPSVKPRADALRELHNIGSLEELRHEVVHQWHKYRNFGEKSKTEVIAQIDRKLAKKDTEVEENGMRFDFEISQEKLQSIVEDEVSRQIINQVVGERYSYEKKWIKEAVSEAVRKALESTEMEAYLENKIVDKAADILAKKGLAKLLEGYKA